MVDRGSVTADRHDQVRVRGSWDSHGFRRRELRRKAAHSAEASGAIAPDDVGIGAYGLKAGCTREWRASAVGQQPFLISGIAEA